MNDIDVESLFVYEPDVFESQMKTISAEEYRNLIQHSIEVERLKSSITRMENVIRSKDAKLKEIQQIHNDGKWLNLSKLSKV